MSDEIIACPHCQRQLRLDSTNLGQNVRCPVCDQQFVAQLAPLPPPVPPTSVGPLPRKLPQALRREEGKKEIDTDEEDFEEDEAWERRYRRRDHEPHRANVILTFGILGLVCLPIPFSLLAWILGSQDLKAMQENRMDPRGEGSTNAGRICGIIGTVFALFTCSGFFLLLLLDWWPE